MAGQVEQRDDLVLPVMNLTHGDRVDNVLQTLFVVETRTSGSKQVWQLLKNACEASNEDAQALIQAAQLQLPQESLTTAIDQAGVYYRVPICCI